MSPVTNTKMKVIELAKSGVRPGEIAIDLNRMPSTVYHILCQARRAGVSIPKSGNGPKMRSAEFIALDQELARKLAQHALARNIDTKVLIAKILQKITDEDLVDSILDDEVMSCLIA